MNILDQLHYAEKLNNYEADATGATALWPDTTHYIAEVPAGKRWIIEGGLIKPDVNATVVVYTRDSSNNVIDVLASHAATTAQVLYPTSAYFIGEKRILDAEEQVYIVFGVAQGVGAYASCRVLEVNI